MTSTTVPTSNGKLLRRPLETPSIGLREPAVLEALDALTKARKPAVDAAKKVIDENGLTIEVARLRERLIGLPPTDLRRQLLATKGVPERLFLDAVHESLTASGYGGGKPPVDRPPVDKPPVKKPRWARSRRGAS